jgi:hypothetical protein
MDLKLNRLSASVIALVLCGLFAWAAYATWSAGYPTIALFLLMTMVCATNAFRSWSREKFRTSDEW